MAKPAKRSTGPMTGRLVISFDAESVQALTTAAELRRISVSDYVRSAAVAQARREIASAREQSPEEQLSFWQALQSPVELTPPQKRLGALMPGKQRR